MELTINQALQQGIAAHNDGNLQDAEQLYRAILQAQPDHPDANHNLGVLAVAVGKPFEALPLFKRALDANPKIDQFWLSYIDALITLERFDEAKSALIDGRNSGVVSGKLDALKQRLQGSVPNDTTKAAKGQTLKEKRKSLAEKKKSKKKKAQGSSSKIEPSQDQLNHLLEHYRAGRLEDAEVLATSYTQKFPTHPFGWKALGVVLQHTGRLNESIFPMQKSVELSSFDVEAIGNLGLTFQKLGRLDESEASHRQAIALNPDYAEAHSNLGITLKELGRLVEAEESYKQAIALKPDYAEAHYNLGNTLRELGRLDEAKHSYKQAIALNPDYADAHTNLGATAKELGRLGEAEDSHKQAIVLKPDFADAHYNLGATLDELGRLDEAEASYRQAIALKTDYAEAHNNLGVTLEKLGRLDEAEASYRQAIALRPHLTDASQNILKLPVGHLDPKALELFEREFPTPGESAEDQVKHSFLKANLHKHRGLFDQSFREFCNANKLKFEIIQNEIALQSERHTQSFHRIKGWMPTGRVSDRQGLVKLFILGPSRSGKSLTEKILCKSSQVKPMFEAVNYSSLLNTETNKRELPESLFDSIFCYGEEELLRQGYRVVTSTRPESVFYADYLQDMLPNTYFLVLKRDVRDLSAEIFTREYASGNDYSYDVTAISNYLSVYNNICHVLHSKIPDRCIGVNFDEIIGNPSPILERIGELVSERFEVGSLNKKNTKFESASIFRDHFAKISGKH